MKQMRTPSECSGLFGKHNVLALEFGCDGIEVFHCDAEVI
jgi:hypothetical protein